jgi:hypothetical protein
MMQFIEIHHLTGLIIGVGTFLIIGIFHPIVIKAEYFFGVRCWFIFLLSGVVGVVGSVMAGNILVSALCGVFAFTSFWAIKELFEQKKRVEKGWFPRNPDRKTKS